MDLKFATDILVAALAGSVLGAAALWLFYRLKLGGFGLLANEILSKAECDADALKREAELTIKQRQFTQQHELEQHWQNERRKQQREDERLKLREDKVESRMSLVEKKMTDFEKREAALLVGKEQLELERKKVAEIHSALLEQLEKASGFSSGEARAQLLDKLTNDVKTDAANLIRRIKKEAEENAEREATTIIATAINRLSASCVSDITVNTVPIPNEEIKGRIIGKEGRNIRTLERMTGVNFIIDDTPGLVVLSCFDPVRMHIAKITLTDLVADGRIHPTRIEETVEKAKVSVSKQIKMFGEDAALRAGIVNLHPELSALLGKLKFRYSYGQNVLAHSLEVSYLMGIMAAELGLDQLLAKRIGLLHDIGKAVSHEVEGSHAIIGHDLAVKFGETKFVANGIGCHHQEMEPITLEGSLCSAADSLSASRPGARIEDVEEYVKRLKRLEEIACEFKGVERAFAMQAGREVRVIVMPDVIDDDGVINLARDLTKRIEAELRYPGKIKVTVIRERRIVEYAL
jgi:ribonuclease Y